MAVRDGRTYKTVDDLKGLDLGTVEGYVWVKSIQAVPGAELHAYPDANGVLDDLGAGRVDVGPSPCCAGSAWPTAVLELSGNNNRLDWRRVVAVALASRHYLGHWFDDPDDLVSLIRDPWVGGRPFLPDGLPVVDRVPGNDNAFAATGHGMLGVTLGPVTGHRLTEYVLTGRRLPSLAPFRFDRLRR